MSRIHNFGKKGELEAAKYLSSIGYKIIETNFRSKLGEIDIIALDKETIVFVEVKTRSSNLWGEPMESITNKKLRSIIKTCQFYMLSHYNNTQNIRIDAVEVILIENFLKVNHIKNITL